VRNVILRPCCSLLTIYSLLLPGYSALAGDDKPVTKAISDMLGVTSDQGIDKIDYNERPKLVMPKSNSELPAPREKPALPDGWPVDATTGTRRTDRFARAPNAPLEKPKPNLMERIRGPVTNTAAGSDDEPGLLQKIITNKQRSAEAEPDDPVRQLLSEPPDGLRSPTIPLKNVKDTTPKSGFLGKIFAGESNDNDPVAQTAGVNEPMKKPSPADSIASGGSSTSSLSDYLPSFLKK
jgi:hypothetical protein